MTNPIREDLINALFGPKRQEKKPKRRMKPVARKNRLERQMEKMDPLNHNAAGLDIGSEEIYAAVPADRDQNPVRAFKTFTQDLNELADWLQECGIDTVAMESTGIYWVPIYEILQERGLEVYLVNARHMKNVPGRKKSDVFDSQWIQKLHTYGLLEASFRPSEEISALRSLIRHRDNLIRYRAAHIQHMQKALLLMNLQLTLVVSDITGTTGLAIIRQIIAGERDPDVLATLRDPRCKRTEEEISKALEGHYKAEHVFELSQALDLYDAYSSKMAECDAAIELKFQEFEVLHKDLPADRKRRRKRANDPDYDLRRYLYQICGVDLTQVDGIGPGLAQTIISEIGTDMSRFKTVKHFCSWLGLSPQHEKSGGKVLKSKTKKTKSRANKAFRLAAQSAGKSKSAIGAFYRRIKSKKGAAMAITATAHKIARIVYFMLKNQTPFEPHSQQDYDAAQRERAIADLKRRARRLGFEVEAIAA